MSFDPKPKNSENKIVPYCFQPPAFAKLLEKMKLSSEFKRDIALIIQNYENQLDNIRCQIHELTTGSVSTNTLKSNTINPKVTTDRPVPTNNIYYCMQPPPFSTLLEKMNLSIELRRDIVLIIQNYENLLEKHRCQIDELTTMGVSSTTPCPKTTTPNVTTTTAVPEIVTHQSPTNNIANVATVITPGGVTTPQGGNIITLPATTTAAENTNPDTATNHHQIFLFQNGQASKVNNNPFLFTPEGQLRSQTAARKKTSRAAELIASSILAAGNKEQQSYALRKACMKESIQSVAKTAGFLVQDDHLTNSFVTRQLGKMMDRATKTESSKGRVNNDRAKVVNDFFMATAETPDQNSAEQDQNREVVPSKRAISRALNVSWTTFRRGDKVGMERRQQIINSPENSKWC